MINYVLKEQINFKGRKINTASQLLTGHHQLPSPP